jgi:radical SAM superfamily enzyme YgiQ (UPF0313 family)
MVEDLDSLPFPAYHLFPMEHYRPALGLYRRLPAVGMITSRGCPYECTFCATQGQWGRRTRLRSAENIVEEIRMLQTDFGIREVFFYDDTFTVSKERVQNICEQLLKGGIDLSWTCMSRVNTIDMELLRLMKRAGCHHILYGIESGDNTILDNIKKRIDLEQAYSAVAMTQKAGIAARASFMFGNQGETEETMQRTLDYAIKLDPDFAFFNVATPYPGTAMYDWALENGYLKTHEWDLYDASHSVVELPTVTAEAVERFQKHAMRRFYLRPGYLSRRLIRIRSWEEAKVAAKAFAAVVGMGGN